jgi:beta-glucanase (GH16 family)
VWTDFVADPGRFSKSSIRPKYANDFFIYTLEWTRDSLVWKINGIEIARQTSDIPHEPMYLLLAGGVETPVSSMTTMEVDWVKVYQCKE